MPRRVAALVEDAVRAARAASDRWLGAGECLERVAEHFLDTWKDALAERTTVQKRVLARDHGLCTVPGCSRPAVHVHHLRFRSHGGGDDEANLTSLCAVHHLCAAHGGYLRVEGRAPDALEWTLTAYPRGGFVVGSGRAALN